MFRGCAFACLISGPCREGACFNASFCFSDLHHCIAECKVLLNVFDGWHVLLVNLFFLTLMQFSVYFGVVFVMACDLVGRFARICHVLAVVVVLRVFVLWFVGRSVVSFAV